MKKLLLLLVVFACCMQGFAQKGMQGLGVNASVNVKVGDRDGVGVGGSVKYQYNVTNYIRLEPSFSYYGVSDDAFDMAAFVNIHLFFTSPQVFRPYFFAGLGYASFSDETKGYYGKDREAESQFGLNAGFGADYRVSHKVSLQAEAGTMLGVGKDPNFALRFNLGFCYNF